MVVHQFYNPRYFPKKVADSVRDAHDTTGMSVLETSNSVALTAIVASATVAIVTTLVTTWVTWRTANAERRFRWDLAERAETRKAAQDSVVELLIVLDTFESWVERKYGEPRPVLPDPRLRARIVAFGHDHTRADFNAWFDNAEALLDGEPEPRAGIRNDEKVARKVLTKSLIGLVRGETSSG